MMMSQNNVPGGLDGRSGLDAGAGFPCGLVKNQWTKQEVVEKISGYPSSTSRPAT